MTEMVSFESMGDQSVIPVQKWSRSARVATVVAGTVVSWGLVVAIAYLASRIL